MFDFEILGLYKNSTAFLKERLRLKNKILMIYSAGGSLVAK